MSESVQTPVQPRRLRLCRSLVTLGGVLAALALASGGWAYLTAPGSGTGTADVGTLAAPAVDATLEAPLLVRVAWSAVPAPTEAADDAEVTFTVERRPSSGAWTFVCGTATAPKPHDVLACDDAVAAPGVYDYRVTAHFRTWTAEGTDSVTVTGDTTPPQAVSILRDLPSPTNASTVSWTVTFSEDVAGVDATDFALAGDGASGAAVTAVSGGGAAWTVEALSGADGSLRLDLVDDDSIEDLAGIPLGGPGAGNGDAAGEAYLVDRTAPAVVAIDRAGTSPTNAGPLVWTVVFSEPVSGVHVSDFGLVSSGITGTPTVSSATPSGAAPTSTWTVSASVVGVTGTNAGSIRLDLTSPGVVTDVAANPLAGTFTGQAYAFDTTAPALVSLEMLDVDLDGKVDRAVATFDETLATPYTAPTSVWTLANAPGGTSNTLASVAVAASTATLILNEGVANTASGSFTIALAASATGIRDALGNQSSFAPASVADRAAPVPINVALANGGTLGRADSQDRVTVTYSETLDATSFCSTWSNGSTQTIQGNGVVDVLITNNGANDVLTIADVGSNCGGLFRFGSVHLAANYVNANTMFSGSGGNQGQLRWNPSANTLTITLGAGTGSQTGVPASAPVYTPNAALRDLASPANTMSATAFTAPATSRF